MTPNNGNVKFAQIVLIYQMIKITFHECARNRFHGTAIKEIEDNKIIRFNFEFTPQTFFYVGKDFYPRHKVDLSKVDKNEFELLNWITQFFEKFDELASQQ